MQEIKCPKCGEVFTVDESGYAAIVGQVRDEEFHRELAQREKQLAAEKEKDLALVRTQAARSQEQSEAQLQRQIEELKAQLLSQQAQRELAGYYAMVRNLDWNVGRLVQALDKLNLADDTYIVFFSDHGDMHGSHG